MSKYYYITANDFLNKINIIDNKTYNHILNNINKSLLINFKNNNNFLEDIEKYYITEIYNIVKNNINDLKRTSTNKFIKIIEHYLNPK